MSRMPIHVLAALLVTFPATAAAQETAHDRPTFALHLEPRVLHAKPGAEVPLRVVVDSLVEQEVALASSMGRLASPTVAASPERPGGAALRLLVPEDAPPRFIVTVTGTGPDGESHEAQAVVETTKRPAPPLADVRVVLERGASPTEARIHVEARTPQTVHLALHGVPDGWNATVSPATLEVGPDAPGHATITLARADSNASLPLARVTLVATGEGDARVALHALLGEPRPCAPDACPRPAPMPRPWAHRGEPGGMYDLLLQRLLRIEAALRAAGIHVAAQAEA